MSVDLWFAPSSRYPGGFKSTFNTRAEALAQAAHDISINRDPAPVRVEEDGSVQSVEDALTEE